MSSNAKEVERRRRQAGGGHGFASKHTSTTRSLQEFRHRKEKKFLHNAALLRGYKKAMKAEGFDAGHGANRKRRRTTDDKEIQEDGGDASRSEGTVMSRKGENHKRPRKMDPLAKARSRADASRMEREEKQRQQEERHKMEVGKAQQRKKRYKQMTQRTKKGQPVMKNVISGMLEKLQREAGGG
mmetsp:Transcript_62282/g.184267  ORF Transcript_62282/g.184267 Transcript_62282/m.184267 type:complete len:184 (-) Transcript_62282:160-711(-)|eukprot:CAMPEP_0113544616 /NCGR_PEP_ID=MMETSP0015_2-20120614/10807_1 /TAXON_ID=2838 /ORGANISM="Odontella" /LENGTH=183 /DNA_ID=CAMNT_0000444895 /DNA_START=316 /DNA_END=867 /DNA_ORIENTATION=- /assembly_acc=CAM_ASM_000160